MLVSVGSQTLHSIMPFTAVNVLLNKERDHQRVTDKRSALCSVLTTKRNELSHKGCGRIKEGRHRTVRSV